MRPRCQKLPIRTTSLILCRDEGIDHRLRSTCPVPSDSRASTDHLAIPSHLPPRYPCRRVAAVRGSEKARSVRGVHGRACSHDHHGCRLPGGFIGSTESRPGGRGHLARCHTPQDAAHHARAVADEGGRNRYPQARVWCRRNPSAVSRMIPWVRDVVGDRHQFGYGPTY